MDNIELLVVIIDIIVINIITSVAFNQFEEARKSSGRWNKDFHCIIDFDPVVSDDDFIHWFNEVSYGEGVAFLIWLSDFQTMFSTILSWIVNL